MSANPGRWLRVSGELQLVRAFGVDAPDVVYVGGRAIGETIRDFFVEVGGELPSLELGVVAFELTRVEPRVPISRKEQARAIAVALQGFHRAHDLDVHGGARCGSDRINMLAFLAHRVGLVIDDDVDLRVLAELVARMRDYDAVHAEHDDAG